MNLREYQEKSTRTLNKELTEKETISNMVFGIQGEAGEVTDILKKFLYQGHGLNIEHIEEELGDMMFYIVNLCNVLGLDLEYVIQQNHNKLLKRYPKGFSEERSINRG